MELTETEKQIIYAYRNGADIDIYYHQVPTVDEAILLVSKFGEVKHFRDLAEVIATANGKSENPEVTAFVKNGRAYIND